MKISSVKTKEAAQELLRDQNKFAQFANHNKKFISSIIGKIKNIENYDYEDLYQEALITLYEALKSYDPEQRVIDGKKSAGFSTYSYYLIRNEIFHYVNEMNKISSNEKSIENYKLTKQDNDNDNDVYDERKFVNKKDYVFENDVIQKIDDDNIMDKLTPTEKIIFQKKIIEDCNHDEVAKALKIPASTYMTIYYKSFVPKLKSIGYKVVNTTNKRKRTKK